MKRKAAPAPRPTRKPRRKPRAAAPQAPGDVDPLAGSALRPLLERYCKLAGVKQAALGPDHTELKLPPAERPFFRDRERVSVAFSLDALERDPEAEIAVLGSPFASQVVEAIRARAAWLSLGLRSSPLSRRAGGTAGEAAPVPAREPGELLQLLVSHLRARAGERVATRRAAAEQELAAELGRLDRYFESVLKEQADAEAIATVSALAERRRAEEIRRSQVKAVVHPLQLVAAAVLMQRAEWRLESGRGRRATFAAQRSLSGGSGWSLTCPHCGRPPAALVICRHDHCGCEACSHRCSVCAEDFCADHGTAECRVDGLPACDEHVQVCSSCRLEHCTAHAGVCAEDGHAACSACLAPCGSCGREVCNRHSQRSHADAPKGSRRLCPACLRYCEGGTNEPVGVDEVAPCSSCGKSVCTAHQAVCAVDEQVHCSLHLRRADRSRRLVCARQRAACAEAPAGLL